METAKSIMQEGLDFVRSVSHGWRDWCAYQTSKVCMRPNRGRVPIPRRARWTLDTPGLTATGLLFRVSLQQLPFRKSQLPLQDPEQHDINRPRLLHERYDGIVHPLIDRSRVRSMHGIWPGEDVVLGDIDKFDSVGVPEFVHSAGSSGFVAEGGSLVALLE